MTITARLDPATQSPELFRAFSAFSAALNACGIEPGLRHLLEVRASQLNGCALCLDMHVKQATIHGERALRLHHLAIWRESALFTARERAALAWTEVLTRLPEHGVPDELFDSVRSQLSDREIADLTFVVMAINGWNRLNVAFRTPAGAMDAAFGLDRAQLA